MYRKQQRTAISRRPPVPPKPKPNTVKDPVEVYCRLKPLDDDEDVVCATKISSTTLQLNPVDMTRGALKALQYSFKYVFDDTTSQKALFDHVALPLVEEVLSGKNALLFTYGVTGSGKTFTMKGSPENSGIVPRVLDVIFNSLGDLQTCKYIFKSDKLNGFDVQTKADAMLDRQQDLQFQDRMPKTSKMRRREAADAERCRDFTKVEDVDREMNYAVFVTYTEIYNNYVYDLLEEVTPEALRHGQKTKYVVREDANKNGFVFMATEVEVKDADEAFDVFQRGQERKRVAATTLNLESSRSHSVFTVRIVQAPIDPSGDEVVQDKNAICISQFSLVDLAGSERAKRTMATKERLAEASNINKSLATLRTCIEYLRDNQLQGGSKMVPYRQSKITHLLKNYFEGEGRIRMILCVNPTADDYDETLQVMQFAELTQEVQIGRPVDNRAEIRSALTVRRKAAVTNNMKNLEVEDDIARVLNFDDAPSPIFDLPACPSIILESARDETTLSNLIAYLEGRNATGTRYADKYGSVRENVSTVERNEALWRIRSEEKDVEIKRLRLEIDNKENVIGKQKKSINDLHANLTQVERSKMELQKRLDDKDRMLNRGLVEKERMRADLQGKFMSEKERIARQMEKRAREKQAEMQNQNLQMGQKINLVKQIISTNEQRGRPVTRSQQRDVNLNPPSQHRQVDSQLRPSRSDPKLDESIEMVVGRRSISPPPERTIPVANLRHRRSRSTGADTWLDHRPSGTLEMASILQPVMKRKISCSKLNVKDVTKEASKYVLMHQEQDSEGDVETQMFKGDVIPTAGGGAQVVFNEVEKLTQESPQKRKSSSSRKRSHSNSRKSGDATVGPTTTNKEIVTRVRFLDT